MIIWARLIIALLIAVVAAPPALAVEITEPPPHVSTEAVKAFNRGVGYHRQKQWANAIKEYERAIDLGGRFPEAFSNLAYAYRKLGMVDKAIELYKLAIALRPLFPEAHDYLARAHIAKGDKASAMREYEIVRRLDQKLAVCLLAAIQTNNPDHREMKWNDR